MRSIARNIVTLIGLNSMVLEEETYHDANVIWKLTTKVLIKFMSIWMYFL